MKGLLQNAIFENYGMYNVLDYEEGDKRGYLTFTCGQGTFVAVIAKYSERVQFYKYEKEFITE